MWYVSTRSLPRGRRARYSLDCHERISCCGTVSLDRYLEVDAPFLSERLREETLMWHVSTRSLPRGRRARYSLDCYERRS